MLRGARLRITSVRLGVIELLARSGRPMSVPQMLGKLQGFDTVTVYRTLATFAARRLVHRVRGGDDGRTWMYALGGAGDVGDDKASASHGRKHPHFVCDDCGKVECLEGAAIPHGLVQSLGVAPAYAISYPEVVLHGVCPRCRE